MVILRFSKWKAVTSSSPEAGKCLMLLLNIKGQNGEMDIQGGENLKVTFQEEKENDRERTGFHWKAKKKRNGKI